jgi:para-nitrobenzyl esterase
MKKLLLLIALLPVVAYAQHGKHEIIAGKGIGEVEIESGKIRGYIEDGIFTYKGIPYAYAERFQAPVKVDKWDGERFMGYYGPTAPLDFDAIAARGNGVGMFALQNDWGYPSENCQNLNIWTPGLDKEQYRPVIVWIHGGGYAYGSSHELPFYDGKNLSKKGDIVYVSVNHRLNILGFTDMSKYGEKYKYSANAGLLDLIEALEWIKRNISEFGGDPDNITVFGQSGGGGKITALLNSPMSEGLIQQAVIMSGSFAQEYADQDNAQRLTDAIMEELGIQPENIDDILKVRYDKLLQAGNRCVAKLSAEAKEKGESTSGFGWGPIEDGLVLPYKVFDPEVIRLILDVNIMIGTVKTEFSGMAAMKTGEDMEATKAAIKEKYKKKADAYMEAVLKAYPDTKKASDYLTIDFMFRSGAVRDANKLTEGGNKNTYMYLWTWESPVEDGNLKAMHCMELPFFFNNIYLGKELTGGGKEAYELADKISGSLINFARTGYPGAWGLPKWPGYSVEEGATMILDKKCEVKYHHDKELLEVAGIVPQF